MLLLLFADINECMTNNPCKNGATCENIFGGYTCRCVIGFKGQNCDQGKSNLISPRFLTLFGIHGAMPSWYLIQPPLLINGRLLSM